MIPKILKVIIRLKPALFNGAGEPAMISLVCFLGECLPAAGRQAGTNGILVRLEIASARS